MSVLECHFSCEEMCFIPKGLSWSLEVEPRPAMAEKINEESGARFNFLLRENFWFEDKKVK